MTKRKPTGKGQASLTNRRLPKNSRLITYTCPTCRGSGRYGNHACGLCGGNGTIEGVNE